MTREDEFYGECVAMCYSGSPSAAVSRVIIAQRRLLNFRTLVSGSGHMLRKDTLNNTKLFSGLIRRYRTMAVIGAGPAGISTTKAILKLYPEIRVDIYEKLPVPYGLIRYGVAPDNLGAKNVTKLYNNVLSDDRVRLLANVEVGKHLRYRDLLKFYDSIVIAIGINTPKTPPVEYLRYDNVFIGDAFVKWYNGHPQYVDSLNPNLSAGANMVIVGHGNVSCDIVRTVLTHVDILKKYDVPSSVLESIKSSKIRRVTLIGRRGINAVKFTPKEVRSITESPYIKVIPRNRSYIDSLDGSVVNGLNRAATMLYKALKEPSEANAENKNICEIEFFSTIRNVILDENTKKLKFVEIVRTCGDHVEVHKLPCDLLVFSYGYEVSKLEDIQLGENPHVVTSSSAFTSPAKAGLPPGMFVSGFPTTMFGYNIPNSIRIATIGASKILDYLRSLDVNPNSGKSSYDSCVLGIEKKLRDTGVQVIDFKGWMEINDLELSMGRLLEKTREKITSSREMLSVASRHGK